jgi:hypothetical protein
VPGVLAFLVFSLLLEPSCGAEMWGKETWGGGTEGRAVGGWGVTILSPFLNEPLESDEFEVSVNVSGLTFPCSVDIQLNGQTVASRILAESDPSNSVWTWRPEETFARALEGFHGLEVSARTVECMQNADTSNAHQRCRVDETTVIARAALDFEIVNFTKLLYSGACPARTGKGHAGEDVNVTQEELLEVLQGRRAATTSMLKTLAPMVARRLTAHQHRGRHCPIARFVLWNSFGVHGFGSQLYALRIGLEYGFRTNRFMAFYILIDCVALYEAQFDCIAQHTTIRIAWHGKWYYVLSMACAP